MLADRRGARIGSDDRPFHSSVRRRPVHCRQRDGGARNPRGSSRRRRDHRAARRRRIAVGHRGGGARAEAERPCVCSRARDRCAAVGVDCRGTSRVLHELEGVVRRRRRRQIGARDDVAAAQSTVGIDRRLARCSRARDEACGGARARHRRGRRRLRDCRGARRQGRRRQDRRRRLGRQHRPRQVRVARRRLRFMTGDGLLALPERLHRLEELAADLWSSWHPEARAVFRRLDYTLWRATAHNPVRMLRLIPPDKLQEAAQERAFVEIYDRAIAALDDARAARNTWWSRAFAPLAGQSIAYFSAEFALHQSLPIYAGGLGVLAGDHCKEASDLGVPLLGVGFMYAQGDFHRKVSAEGWQAESYERLNWADAPVEQALTADGKPCITAVPLGDRSVLVAVWRVRIGRVKLYLLDTDLEENAPWDRELSARLYGGDRETRVQQEIILGVGGVRALKALGSDPAVFHLNEGHAAFVVLQRIRDLTERGSTFDEALEEIRRTTVFTTHTPVPAGHDTFPFHLVEKHLAGCWGTLGPHRDRFLALGSYDSGSGDQFNMTALALRSALKVNAVSQLHGRVTRAMFGSIWPGVDEAARPVAPGRRRRQASPPARVSPRARAAVQRTRRIRRRLRSPCGALPGAGLRRVAQQPAQAARGERHERYESRD